MESFIEDRCLLIVLELADAGDLAKMIKHFQGICVCWSSETLIAQVHSHHCCLFVYLMYWDVVALEFMILLSLQL